MSFQETINVSPNPEDQSEYINRLRAMLQRWSRIPALKRIVTLLRRGVSVAEPTSRIHIHHNPRLTKSEAESITVVSANLCHDWPLFRSQLSRLETFARLAEQVKADIILLQEVARTSTLKVDDWLVDRLEMSSIYTRANGSLNIGFEEGLAVLSRFPLSEPRFTHLLPAATPLVRRLALGAKAATPAGPLWIFSVHLGLNQRNNIAQQASLRRMVSFLPANQPAVLGGDFNSHESTPQIRENKRIWTDTFRHLHPKSDGTTHSFSLPAGGTFHRRRLDYIFLRSSLPGWTIQETGHLISEHLPHSDHHVVYTRLAPASPG